MAREFGVSRSSVFNAMEQAQAFGVRIQAVRGKGYRLPHAIDWLDSGFLNRRLTSLIGNVELYLHSSLDSTNTWLLDRLEDNPGTRICCAEHQTGGRGRRGRSWRSALGGGLTFSLAQRFETGMAALAGLSLVAGVGVAQAINRHLPVPVGLKWPNDLVVGVRKLGGILVEVRGDLDGAAHVVIGVGLNVHLPANVREDIEQAVVDLEELGLSVGRNVLLADILISLHETLTRFRREGFSGLRDEWQALDAYRGKTVKLLRPDGSSLSGIEVGVDEAGSLLLDEGAGGVSRHLGGELSMRLAI